MSHGSIPLKCRDCDAPLHVAVICDQCRTVQPLSEQVSYFDLLGLEPEFDLDPEALRRQFFELSRRVHPDRRASDGDERAALVLSAHLNAAYEALRDPVSRAEHLLSLHGGASAVQDKSVPPDVLTRTLLVREELDDATQRNDRPAMDALRRQVSAERDELLTRISATARCLPQDDARSALRRELNSIKYFTKILEQIDG